MFSTGSKYDFQLDSIGISPLDSAMAFGQGMEQAGVVADVVVYSGLLDACAKAGDLARAKEVFARTDGTIEKILEVMFKNLEILEYAFQEWGNFIVGISSSLRD